MVKLIQLVPSVESFIIGDANTRKKLPPESVAEDRILYAEVKEITAENDTPVIWLDI